MAEVEVILERHELTRNWHDGLPERREVYCSCGFLFCGADADRRAADHRNRILTPMLFVT